MSTATLETLPSPTTTAPATFYAVQGGNDLYWRCEAPAREVGAIQTIASEEEFLNALYPNVDTGFPWQMQVTAGGQTVIVETAEEWLHVEARDCDEITTIFPNHEGTAIWIRPDMARAVLMRSMAEQHGWRVLAEVDDNYLTNPNLSLFLKQQNWTEATRRNHLKGLAAGHGIVFSTAALRDVYWKGYRERWGKINSELHVCRNHIASTDWPEIVPRIGPIRVGWMGSPSHVWDVDIAYSALAWSAQQGATVYMIGYHPAHSEYEIAGGKAAARSVKSKRAISKMRRWEAIGGFHVPWRQPAKYERLALPLDIGLCPLRTDAMTLGKSDVKAIEYTVSGAAVVAQNNIVYNKDWIHGETAMLAGSEQQMVNYVALLMRDENLRERLVQNAQQYVREERSEKQLQAEWMQAIG